MGFFIKNITKYKFFSVKSRIHNYKIKQPYESTKINLGPSNNKVGPENNIMILILKILVIKNQLR